MSPLDTPHALLAEYEEAYAVGFEHAAALVWQSMTRRDDGAPDWDLDEFKRPGGGFYWKRGDKTEPANPWGWLARDVAQETKGA